MRLAILGPLARHLSLQSSIFLNWSFQEARWKLVTLDMRGGGGVDISRESWQSSERTGLLRADALSSYLRTSSETSPSPRVPLRRWEPRSGVAKAENNTNTSKLLLSTTTPDIILDYHNVTSHVRQTNLNTSETRNR